MGALYSYETSIFYSLGTNNTRSTQLMREVAQQIVVYMQKHSNHIESQPTLLQCLLFMTRHTQAL